MPRIVRDIQLLVNDDDDHLYGYRLSDGTEVRIGTSRPDNAAAVVGAAGALTFRGRMVLGLLGDSLMNRVHTTSGLSAAPTYDAETGVAVFAQTSHGHYSGMQCRITNTAGDMFDNLTLTRIDANSFSVVLPVGQTMPSGETWYISLRSAYHEESPYTHLRGPRPDLRVYAASGANAPEIRAKLLPLALAGDANVVWVRMGTNDITGGVSVFDSVMEDYEYCVSRLLAAGKAVIVSTLPPYGSTAAGGAWTANAAARIRAIAEQYDVYLIDEYAIGVDPTSATGSARSGYLVADNTHLTPKYAALIAAKAQAIIDNIGYTPQPRVPASALDAYNGTDNATSTQPFPNPTLITTNGGTNGSTTPITGTVASGITVYATGGFGAASVAASVPAAADGIGNCQRLVAAPTANNDLLRITTRAADSIVAGLLTAGERRRAVAHLVVTGLTGQAVLQSCVALLVFTTSEGTFSTRVVDHNWAGTAAQINQADIDRYIETDFVVPVGVTSLYLDVQLKFAAAGTAVTMQLSQIGFPLID